MTSRLKLYPCIFRRLWKIFLFSAFSFSIFVQTAFATCCKCSNSDDSSKIICLNGNTACSQMVQQSNNANLSKITCSSELGEAQCKTVADSGLCTIVGNAATYNPVNSDHVSDESPIAETPNLSVKIPGLTLASNLKPVENELSLPWIGQYISGLYNYVIGISLIAAAVMITYGGFLYILGSTGLQISEGKEKISNALVGLLIVFTATTILNVVNPNLTKPATLKIHVAGHEDALKPSSEKRRVEESSTVKPAEQTTDVAVVSPSGSVLNPGNPPGGTTTQTTQTQQPGSVAKDNYGNYIAQGGCPSDMRAIKYSENYEARLKKHVASFCMDVYEAPNQKGAKPFEGVTEWEADWYCNAQGKRLCTTSEWTRACLGPDGANTYGYGPNFIPGKIVSAQRANSGDVKHTNNPPAPCNYDSDAGGYITASFQSIQHSLDNYTPKSWDEDLLNPENKFFTSDTKYGKSATTYKELWDRLTKAFDKVNAKEPSGERSQCATAEGVFDMTANVQEITLSDDGAKLTINQRIAKGSTPGEGKPYRWRGFYWSPIAHLANTSALPSCNAGWGVDHAVGWRGFENGFRCCMNLSEVQ